MAGNNAVEVGQKAPAISLPDQNGTKVSLSDFVGKWVVVYFYPKDDTPGCTTEACEFTDSLKQYEKLNAVVLGISPDSVDSHKRFAAKHDLKIMLLADPERKVLEKYGAYGEKMMYGKKVTGVIRSTVLVDPKGKVAHTWPTVKAAGHAQKVAEKLTELVQG